MNITEQKHWDKVYSTKAEDEVSWFQHYPKTSMEFVELFNLPLDANTPKELFYLFLITKVKRCNNLFK